MATLEEAVYANALALMKQHYPIEKLAVSHLPVNAHTLGELPTPAVPIESNGQTNQR